MLNFARKQQKWLAVTRQTKVRHSKWKIEGKGNQIIKSYLMMLDDWFDIYLFYAFSQRFKGTQA